MSPVARDVDQLVVFYPSPLSVTGLSYQHETRLGLENKIGLDPISKDLKEHP